MATPCIAVSPPIYQARTTRQCRSTTPTFEPLVHVLLAAPTHPPTAPGADDAAVSQHHGLGGAGAVDLANAVIAACQRPAAFKFTYGLDLTLKVGVWRSWEGRGGGVVEEGVGVWWPNQCVERAGVGERTERRVLHQSP